jgi:hypothetical protein
MVWPMVSTTQPSIPASWEGTKAAPTTTRIAASTVSQHTTRPGGYHSTAPSAEFRHNSA